MTSIHVNEFRILFLKTRFVILLPCRSNIFKFLLVRNTAAIGSVHFSVSLLLAKISVSTCDSHTAFARCYTPSSVILFWLRSIIRTDRYYLRCFTISLMWESPMFFPFKSAIQFYPFLNARLIEESFPNCFFPADGALSELYNALFWEGEVSA